MFANIIYLYAKPLAQKIWLVGLLVGYWLLLTFFAAPGYAAGDMTMEGNIVSYIDSLLIPGKLYLGIHDPEGLIATLPAIGTALMGIFTGNLLLKTTKEMQLDTVKKLIMYGVAALVIAFVWDLIFPINKNLWTSSFTMLCAGISLLLMALFYYIIDVKGYQKWAFFFKVIGMNSILIYMSGRFINWSYSSDALTGWLQQLIGEPFNAVVAVIGFVGVQWVFLYFMFKKKVFLKV
jgi:predicted acyltransferase